MLQEIPVSDRFTWLYILIYVSHRIPGFTQRSTLINYPFLENVITRVNNMPFYYNSTTISRLNSQLKFVIQPFSKQFNGDT